MLRSIFLSCGKDYLRLLITIIPIFAEGETGVLRSTDLQDLNNKTSLLNDGVDSNDGVDPPNLCNPFSIVLFCSTSVRIYK